MRFNQHDRFDLSKNSFDFVAFFHDQPLRFGMSVAIGKGRSQVK
jgi:hypothetical protein